MTPVRRADRFTRWSAGWRLWVWIRIEVWAANHRHKALRDLQVPLRMR
jgi:hypothetical protein